MFLRSESGAAPAGLSPKGVVNFGGSMQSAAGQSVACAPGEAGAGYALSYQAPKTKGSDAGVMATDADGQSYMVKTGVSTSLLNQAVTAYAKAQAEGLDAAARERNLETSEKLLGFIAGNFLRPFGDERNAELKERIFAKKGWGRRIETDGLLSKAFSLYMASPAGVMLVQKVQAGEALTMQDAWNTADGIIALDTQARIEVPTITPETDTPSLKDIIGLATLAEVIFGTAAQVYNNAYQETVLPEGFVAKHALMTGLGGNQGSVMTSKMLEVGGSIQSVEAFEEFLFASFREALKQPEAAPAIELAKQLGAAKKELADLKRSDSIDEDRMGQLEAQIAALTTQYEATDWARTATAELKAKFSSNFQGLISALIVRGPLMGEGQDCNPDNQLVVTAADGAQHLVNVDVTGMRNPRQKYFERFNATGWEQVFEATDTDTLFGLLFNKENFNQRFTWKANGGSLETACIDTAYNAIVDVLKEQCAPTALAERDSVVAWLKTVNATEATRSFSTFVTAAFDSAPESRRPSRDYIERVVAHGSQFLTAPEAYFAAQQTQQEDSAAAPAALA